MKTSDFDYNLPAGMIAQYPAVPRDSSRLMIIDKDIHEIKHTKFSSIINYLQAGDLLVWNNSKVFKARLLGVLQLDEDVTGLDNQKPQEKIINLPEVEIFLLRPVENFGIWKCLAKPGRKLRLGMRVVFAPDFEGEVILKETDGTVLLDFKDEDVVVRTKANKYGQVPTPPYVDVNEFIKNSSDLENKYQTVYASDEKEGSVAAPTAGFHFTSEIIETLKEKGVEFAEVTLHVGLGTFLPVKTEKIEEHKMHSEWVELTDKNVQIINKAKAEGRRVVAVGTTTVRTLEAVAKNNPDNKELLEAYTGEVNIFITPGFKFEVVDALITNFHLPKSTLLMLVSAFAGDREFMLECYEEAVSQSYRFFSFGDAMLIK